MRCDGDDQLVTKLTASEPAASAKPHGRNHQASRPAYLAVVPVAREANIGEDPRLAEPPEKKKSARRRAISAPTPLVPPAELGWALRPRWRADPPAPAPHPPRPGTPAKLLLERIARALPDAG